MKYIGYFILLSILLNSCDFSLEKFPLNKYGEVIDTIHKQVIFSSSKDVLELKSYSTSSSWMKDSLEVVIAYNHRVHALDILNVNKMSIHSVHLFREGPNGIAGKISAIYPVAKDSIWVYDGINMFLLDNGGKVQRKINLGTRDEILIGTNFAMNTSKFVYNKKRHSILYLAKRNGGWNIEEFNLKSNKIVKSVLLHNSVYNEENSFIYANMNVPNVTFRDDKVIYNFPYESSIYVLDLKTSYISIYGGESAYTNNIARTCNSNNDYSVWERHGIENPHFYDVMYLPESSLYVRPHLGGVEYDLSKSLQELGDNRTLYLMFFDENFNIVGEFEMEKHRYSYFTGWCAMSNALLLFEYNSLSDSIDYESLIVDLVIPKIKDNEK